MNKTDVTAKKEDNIENIVTPSSDTEKVEEQKRDSTFAETLKVDMSSIKGDK